MKIINLQQQRDICQFYIDGYNGQQISDMLDLNIKTVYKFLDIYGLTKPPSEAHRIYHLNDHYFSNITTHRQAYWLGFISGDGCIIGKNLIINLAVKDSIILEQFNQDIQSDRNLHTYGRLINFIVNSNRVMEDLAKHNIIPRKTQTFKLSENIGDHLLSSYILGLNDADGCFSIDKKRGLRFSLVGTEKSMQQIQDILIQKCGINRNKLQKHHTTPYVKYLVYSGDRQLRKIVDYLYGDNDFCLPRKYWIVKDYFGL